MLFNSQIFLFAFLPIVLAAYYACGTARDARLLVLVVASLTFYASWNWHYVPLLVGLTLLNWLLSNAYGRGGRKTWLTLGVVINLATLGVFKYANFLAANIDALFGRVHAPWPILLPLGISFFVFQKIAYLVDLRRGGWRIHGLLEFAAFVTFFPQLIAGPIVRHTEIVPQFDRVRPTETPMQDIARGLALFTVGLAKKAGLADSIAVNPDALFALAATGQPLGLAGGWVAAFCYTLQIYLDFSGYSDMAIGLALMFGLKLPFNFNAPYNAASLRDFWHRWHMTLSRFLRDYVYIPLGGNRRGEGRQMANLAATMLLGGLWHGAAWTYVAWGGLHGVGLAVNHLWNRAGRRMPPFAGWALTLLFVIVGWVLFRAPDFHVAWHMLGAMAGLQGMGHVHVRNAGIVALAAVCVFIGPASQAAMLDRLAPRPWLALPIGAALAFLVILVGGGIPSEFIYFQF
nr:MBOAT family protein [uncultured Lichenicoccus sp.]